MILELFWPKEMRELVNKCHEEGTLNDEAVNAANFIVKCALGGAAIIVILFVNTNMIFGVAVSCVLLLGCKWEMKPDYFRPMCIPYSQGSLLEANVLLTSSCGGIQNKIKVDCNVINSNEIITIGPVRANIWKKASLPQKGDTIMVWVDMESKQAMPDIDYIKQKYSLNSNLLGEK
jgi:hypothetical protein